MFNKRMVSSVAVVAMLALSVGSAMAANNTTNAHHGSVKLSSSEVTPFTVTSAGGGTWNYGTDTQGSQKHAWSYYTHPSLYHSATAIVGTDTEKQYADAGLWAETDAYGSGTGYAYWDTY